MLELPEVSFPELDLKKYKRVVITSKIMNPLFPSKFLSLTKLGDIVSQLKIDEKNPIPLNNKYSWDYEENFPNEIDITLIDDTTENNQRFRFSSPIMAFNDVLVICIEENFIKMSPIFSNVIAEKIIEYLLVNCASDIEFIALGTSDRVSSLKTVSKTTCTLEAPEFVTGFCGSVLTQLIIKEIPFFTGTIAPSEGPVGFEKMTLEVMEELIGFSRTIFSINSKEYSDECHRLWKLDGAAIGAQSGLYI